MTTTTTTAQKLTIEIIQGPHLIAGDSRITPRIGTYFHAVEFAPADFPEEELEEILAGALNAGKIADFHLDNVGGGANFDKPTPVICIWSKQPETVATFAAWLKADADADDDAVGEDESESHDPRFASQEHEASAYRQAANNALEFMVGSTARFKFTIDQRFPIEKPEEGGGAYVSVQLFVPDSAADPETPASAFPTIDPATFMATGEVDDRDYAIMLAAMRHYQADLVEREKRFSLTGEYSPLIEIEDIATNAGQFDPPTPDDIGDVIARILDAPARAEYPSLASGDPDAVTDKADVSA